MQNVVLTVKQMNQIKLVNSKNRIKKHKRFVFWGKTKRFFTKWKNSILFKPFCVVKYFKIGQHKKRFPQKKIARRSFVLKEALRLNFLLSHYNLVVNIKGQEAYLQVKEALEFSQLGLLNFEFWHLNRTWVKSLFGQNLQKVILKKFLNGSVLVIKTQTINELLDTLELFSNFLEQVTPVGVFVSHKFFSISHSLNLLSNFLQTVEDLETKIYKKSSKFGFLFPCLFQFFYGLLYSVLHGLLDFQAKK